MRCDFCGSPTAAWRYRSRERDWLACEKCRTPIEADDRQALLERVLLMPVPRTVPDRYADRFREQAKRLHEEFWLTRRGAPERL
jgi:hypothetical protein